MKHKKYRLCLLSLLILAVVGGILYYNYGMSDKGLEKQAGTFVEKIIYRDAAAYEQSEGSTAP